MVTFRNDPVVRSAKLTRGAKHLPALWTPDMEFFQDDPDPEPIKVISAEVLTPCVKWMVAREFLLSEAKFLMPELKALPQMGSLPSIHEDWDEVIYSDSMEEFVKACTDREAVLYLNIIEMVVDESCLGHNVRQEIYKFWDLFSDSVRGRGIWDRVERCFIFDWDEDSWSKV